MNYEKNYYDYIRYIKTLNRSKNNGIYYELHHIKPKSLFPEFKDLKKNPENGVLLTFREHYLAHYLLTKFSQCREVNLAFWNMNSMNKKNYLNSSLYEYSKNIFNYLKSEERKNNIKGIKRKPYSEEALKRIRESWTPERRLKTSIIQKEIHNRPEMKKAQSERVKISNKEFPRKSMLGKHRRDYPEWKSTTYCGERNPFYGKNHSEEFKQKIREIRGIKIFCFETNELYFSFREAEKKLNYPRYWIKKSLKTGEGKFHFERR